MLDLSDLRCPEPLLQTRLWLRQAELGDQVQLVLADSASRQDIPALLRRKGHLVLQETVTKHNVILQIEKASTAF